MKKLIAICMLIVLTLSTPFSAISQAEEVGISKKINNNPIYIYSRNTEIETILQPFYEKYPEYKKLVRIVNLSTDPQTFSLKIEKLLKKNGAKVPSIVVHDIDKLQQQISDKQYVPLSSIGFTNKDYKNAYDYTKQIGSVNGKLKAVTWDATPGCFLYNVKIAQEVFGTDDPVEIQEQLKDWDSFLNAAAKLKEHGYYIVHGFGDLEYALSADNYDTPLVKKKKIQITDALKADISYLQLLAKNKYIARESMWSENWLLAMNTDTAEEYKVFGYFGCPWFTYWIMNGTSSDGSYNMCTGPANYNWGSDYLAVTKKCKNPGLAALVLKTICSNTTVMTDSAKERIAFPNNKSAVEELMNQNDLEIPLLKEQNSLTLWNLAADKITYKTLTKYDFSLKYDFYNAVTKLLYKNSDSEMDDIIALYKKNVIKSGHGLKTD